MLFVWLLHRLFFFVPVLELDVIKALLEVLLVLSGFFLLLQVVGLGQGATVLVVLRPELLAAAAVLVHPELVDLLPARVVAEVLVRLLLQSLPELYLV